MFHAETEAGRLRHQDTYRQAPQPPLPNGVPLRLCVLLPNQGAAPKALRPLSPGGVVCLCLCALLVRGSLIDAEELTNPAAEAFGTSVTLSTALPFSLITALGEFRRAKRTPLWGPLITWPSPNLRNGTTRQLRF
jgi:hypothetical protein